MDDESESKDKPEKSEKKSNAFLIGLALNLGRATRQAKNGFGAIGSTAYKVGAGVKGQTQKLSSGAKDKKEEAPPVEEDDQTEPTEKKEG